MAATGRGPMMGAGGAAVRQIISTPTKGSPVRQNVRQQSPARANLPGGGMIIQQAVGAGGMQKPLVMRGPGLINFWVCCLLPECFQLDPYVYYR